MNEKAKSRSFSGKTLLHFLEDVRGFFLLFFCLVCYTPPLSSQPIGITKTVDMSFGNIAVVSPGTVVLDPSGSRVGTGGVTLPAITGTVMAASFDITGGADLTYSITLPLNCVISSGGNNMTIDNFTSTPSATGTLSGIGTQQLKIGATLNIGGAQVPGTYMSGAAFSVTVNYN
ncbi:MAG: DUF4402 domain-containing protein [Bacteroidetes bacterium]|nr:DUF4402 domain-containing protein [Bacteroidota bacterium]